MAQLINITSEALQATIRRLLPSQQGFGEDLQASNVITPIIDLTPTAEGSELPGNLQQALSFDSQTVTEVAVGTNTILTTTGFYRVFGQSIVLSTSSTIGLDKLLLNDGTSDKLIFNHNGATSVADVAMASMPFDFIIYLNPGESLKTNRLNGFSSFTVNTRQVADINGNLINPAGFVSQ